MSEQPDRRDRDSELDPDRVVVRDKRRLDPITGAPREGAATAPPPAGEPADDGLMAGEPEHDLATQLTADLKRVSEELTADLQRVSAEYANYRKRVARDQAAVAEVATAALVERLLPLLDDVARAREHGDLEGAFKVVGEGLETVVARLGVERFGAAGDPFDPQVHEAVMSAPADPAATVPVCAQVFAPGYRSASGKVLRPAKVVVAEPGAPDGSPEPADAAPEA